MDFTYYIRTQCVHYISVCDSFNEAKTIVFFINNYGMYSLYYNDNDAS